MIYKIEFSPTAARDFKHLSTGIQQLLRETISSLADDPRPNGVKKLDTIGGYGCYRVRKGDYRIVYLVQDDKLIILVVAIGNRSEVYARFREAAQRAARKE
jgi:mRNA interferase RelE/StbE